MKDLRIEGGKIVTTKTVEVDVAQLHARLEDIARMRAALRPKVQTHLDYDAQLEADARAIRALLKEVGADAPAETELAAFGTPVAR